MKVTFDESGYVNGWCMVGDNGGKEYDPPEDFDAECFSVVNRGWIWYSTLTLSQWRELRNWYIAWLKVTETMTPPERPSWVDDIDTSRIPLTLGGLF